MAPTPAPWKLDSRPRYRGVIRGPNDEYIAKINLPQNTGLLLNAPRLYAALADVLATSHVDQVTHDADAVLAEARGEP
jgi:hypothetical protein